MSFSSSVGPQSSTSGSGSEQKWSHNRQSKRLPLATLDACSQRNFDLVVIPSIPGLRDIYCSVRKKGNSSPRQDLVDMIAAASDGTVPKDRIRTPRDNTIQLCLNDMDASALVSDALVKRMECRDSPSVMRTLELLDHAMRRVPYFYRYIANRRFFIVLWALVDPVITGKAFVEPSFTTKAHRREFVIDGDVANRVLFLIRAWAEEFDPVIGPHRTLDAAAYFIIEEFERRALRMPFPEIPPATMPYVYPTHRAR